MKAKTVTDDGLFTPIVGEWSENKYSLVSYYCGIFGSSMKRTWDCRVYLDLFSGAGNKDKDAINALQDRVTNEHPQADVKYIEGDINKRVDKILDEIPNPNKKFKVLTFCFVDPCKLADLSFKTLALLSAKIYVDFLILIPSYMDAHRNLSIYKSFKNRNVDNFLGKLDWRTNWKKAEKTGLGFGQFLADQLSFQMEAIGFKSCRGGETRLVKDRSLNLYHLAFFSKNKLGKKFWKEAKKYTDTQTDFLDILDET